MTASVDTITVRFKGLSVKRSFGEDLSKSLAKSLEEECGFVRPSKAAKRQIEQRYKDMEAAIAGMKESEKEKMRMLQAAEYMKGTYHLFEKAGEMKAKMAKYREALAKATPEQIEFVQAVNKTRSDYLSVQEGGL